MDGFAGWLGVAAVTSYDGTARAELHAQEPHLNPAGTDRAWGVLATLVDAAMGAAVRSTTGDADVPGTSQLTVAYLNPGTPGRVISTADVRKRGKHLMLCEADVEQDGRPLIHAVATFALVQH